MVQIVADADEGESLFQKLANSRRAEEKQSKDDVIFPGVLDQFLSGHIKFGRSVHVRELVLVVETHRHAKIILAEKKYVDARDSRDLGNVLDARSGFHL